MKITEAKYATTAVKPSQFPNDALPEIALAGRSNVGKSSLINRLLHRKNLARTSSTPGKTQAINFYLINELFYFADVPGYGFAKVSKSIRASWKKMMEDYLLQREPLKAVIQIIDLRHAPSTEDKNMYDFLQYYEIPVVVVATKADKIARGRWQSHLKIVREGLMIKDTNQFVLFSSNTGQGKDELWKKIESYILE